ncbi:hypothetical protein HanRHA438_Chr17g0809281 [Helianthus annuus]|nr:hypothetical protein HanRHA438_Chr17g0809281 [Helianthus annuus]
MKLHDQELFFRCNITPPYIRPEIVQPSKPTTFPERVQERKVEREKNGRRFLIYEER